MLLRRYDQFVCLLFVCALVTLSLFMYDMSNLKVKHILHFTFCSTILFWFCIYTEKKGHKSFNKFYQFIGCCKFHLIPDIKSEKTIKWKSCLRNLTIKQNRNNHHTQFEFYCYSLFFFLLPSNTATNGPFKQITIYKTGPLYGGVVYHIFHCICLFNNF